MNWDELREMEVAGMDIGGHTVSHPVLSRLTPEAQYRELRTSYERIRQECGHRQRAMSYPVGGASAFGRPTQEAARRAEWIMACNYRGGHLKGSIPDMFSVPRLQMQPYTRLPDLAAIFAWPDRFA